MASCEGDLENSVKLRSYSRSVCTTHHAPHAPHTSHWRHTGLGANVTTLVSAAVNCAFLIILAGGMAAVN